MANLITRLETVLQGKIELFNNCICDTCPCVTSTLNLTLSNPEAEKSVEEENNTYLFTSTKLDTDIIFETNPKVTVTSTSILLKDITFVDNVLSIPADFDFSQSYNMTFMIGTDVVNTKFQSILL